MNKIPGADEVYGVPVLPPRRPAETKIVEVERVVEVERQIEVRTPVPMTQGSIDEIPALIIGNIGVTEYGVVFLNASEQEWQAYSDLKNRKKSAMDWGKADWCLYGLDELKKTPEQIAALCDLAPSSVEVYASIARSATQLIRINSPSFSHFRLVEGMSADRQLDWMRSAKENQWSVKELQARIDQKRITVVSGRTVKSDQKQAVAAHKREIGKVYNKALSLPPTPRAEVAAYLRKLADKLDEEQG